MTDVGADSDEGLGRPPAIWLPSTQPAEAVEPEPERRLLARPTADHVAAWQVSVWPGCGRPGHRRGVDRGAGRAGSDEPTLEAAFSP